MPGLVLLLAVGVSGSVPAGGAGSLAIEPVLDPRNVTATDEMNEWNPRFSADGRYLSYERREGSAQAIFVLDLEALHGTPERISSLIAPTPVSAEEALLGQRFLDESFNAQLSFLPDGRRFIFTGNEGSGVYRLYQGSLGGGSPQALTSGSEEDGHPSVSPDGRWLAYVSARSGVGKLFLRDLVSGTERQLTTGPKVDLFPVWSPDSLSLAYTSGDNDNHDVFILLRVAEPEGTPVQLTTWSFDDLRPTFSTSGKWVAFYSNYNPGGEDKVWSIVVVPADGTGPTKGGELAKRAVALNVVKDPEVGPAWLPEGSMIVYARNLKAEFNPIHVVDVETREDQRLQTNTRMNHDLACSAKGILAFRAQVGSWDDIFVSRLVSVP